MLTCCNAWGQQSRGANGQQEFFHRSVQHLDRAPSVPCHQDLGVKNTISHAPLGLIRDVVTNNSPSRALNPGSGARWDPHSGSQRGTWGLSPHFYILHLIFNSRYGAWTPRQCTTPHARQCEPALGSATTAPPGTAIFMNKI